MDKGPIKVDIKLLRETLLRLVPDKKERIMGWFSQPYYDQGPCRLTTDMSQPQHQKTREPRYERHRQRI
jgi:hypothetical protein